MLDLKDTLRLRLNTLENRANGVPVPTYETKAELEHIRGRIIELKYVLRLLMNPPSC